MSPDQFYTYPMNVIPAMSDRPPKTGNPPMPNGYLNSYDSFAQRESTQKDIAERGVESDYVYPFSTEPRIVEPLANPWLRPYLPYTANGGSNVYAQTEAAPMKDIANKEVRPDVWVEVHKHVNPIAWGRYREPRTEEEPVDRSWDEGPKEKEAPEPEFKFKKPEEKDEDEAKAKREADAAENKEKAKAEKAKKDEDATKTDPEDLAKKPEKADEEKPEKSKKEVEAEKKEAAAEKAAEADAKKADAEAEKEEKASAAEKEKKEAEKKKASLAQVKDDKEGEKKEGEEEKPKAKEPEKVHVLDPVEFKEKADTNAPTARTTFYNKKNSKKAQI